MKNQEQIKRTVKEKYSTIAMESYRNNSCCSCGCLEESSKSNPVVKDEYKNLDGYMPDADLGLGCGIPTEYARLKKGDTVVDLGSGAGNDCFVARAAVGEEGLVIGLDMSEPMVHKARENAIIQGYNNVEFHVCEIEQMILEDNTADVVISNCVLNLVPAKRKVLSEIYRILRPGGHFSISDIVLNNPLPGSLKTQAELYVGCIAGASLKKEYMAYIEESGFKNIEVLVEKEIPLQEEWLKEFLSESEIKQLHEANPGIRTITIYAEKPT